MSEQQNEKPGLDRRSFLISGAAAGAALGLGATAKAESKAAAQPARKPNIVLYLSDQFRWDFLGANGLNGSTKTPNLDALAAAGKNFNYAVTNQPVCAPARSVMMTSRYATDTDVWHNGPAMTKKYTTFATALHDAGYSTNLIGKWHLALENPAQGGSYGPVKLEDRGGFNDLGRAPTRSSTPRTLTKAPSGTTTAKRLRTKIATA